MKKMMLFTTLSILLMFPSLANAYVAVPVADWTGYRSTLGTNEITAASKYLTDGFMVSWNITYDAGLYTYLYRFTTPTGAPLTKNLSHAIIEVTPGVNNEIIVSDGVNTPGAQAPATYSGTDGGGNAQPNMPAPLWGIKLTRVSAATFTLITARDPIWGSFYAKDGNVQGSGVPTAWNYNFLTDPDSSTTNFSGWIPTPDGGTTPFNPIPEPATMALFGFGLGGLALLRRKQTNVRLS